MPLLSLLRVGMMILAASLLACSTDPPPSSAAPAPSAAPSASALAEPAPGALRLIEAPAGVDVAAHTREVLAATKAEGRDLIVYVGATWCEPCERFHQAAQRGELDVDFPKLSLLAFDHDRDGEALEAAGYRSRMIPLFVVPLPDGRSSERQVEGSVKGDRAVATIVPRLRGLLASAASP